MKMFARMKDDLAGFAKDERGEDWTLEDPGEGELGSLWA